MSSRARVFALAAAVTAVFVGVTVGVTLATRTNVTRSSGSKPPFAADPTAPVSLRRDVREALDAWPAGTVRRLRILAAQHPRSALVRLELGIALALLNQKADAEDAWRAAERVQPDSPSAVRAEDLRHRGTPPGRPPFVPSFARPRTEAQLRLARGVQLQVALLPVSAEREFAAAARLAPQSADAQVAAAVGLYDKDMPARAFSTLGPLARRFPRAQTVRFHLGLLLIYFGDVQRAWAELRQSVALAPGTPLAERARILLRAGT